MSNMNGLRRIAVFYDGSFFWRVSNFYKHMHPRQSYIDISGLHEFIRHRVAELEGINNVSLCQIVEAHFFRGRFSLNAVQTTKDPAKQLEIDRYQDQILMWAGVVAHYHPMNEAVSPPEEKGVDVWLALEAYDLAVHKKLDVVVLISGDADFLPLIRKINALGTRVLVIAFDLPNVAKTSQKLIDEASYTVVISDEVDSDPEGKDAVISGIFRN